MVDLLKAFGRGIIYVLCFPFFIVALAIFAVIGLLAFIFQLIKSIIFFFTGQKFFPELPEDKELRLMQEAEEAKRNPQPQPQAQPQMNRPAQGSLMFEETYDEDDFLDEPSPEPMAQPRVQTPIEEIVFEEEPAPEVAPMPTPKPAPQPPIQEMRRPDPEPSKELLHEEEEPAGDFLNPFDAEEEAAEEEELEIYQPKGTNDDIYQIDEEDTDSGVNINFDD